MPDVEAPEQAAGLRATRAVVDLDAFEDNVRCVRERLHPQTALMAVIKAEAYGHGARMIARSALAAGATWLAVATVAEGRRIRRAGITCPILVLGSIDDSEAVDAVRLELDVTVGTGELVRALDLAERTVRPLAPIGVHLKLDTGLGRYGAGAEEVASIARSVAAHPGLRLRALCTHFAAADEDDDWTDAQCGRFRRIAGELADGGTMPDLHHLAASAAVLRGRAEQGNLVRLGIALYGQAPSPNVSLWGGMRPVLSLRTRVARTFDLAPGDSVGYGRTYRASEAERAALLPLGYADGLRRGLSNRGWVGINGQRAEFIGRISMDQSVVRVPAGINVRVGDDVHVIDGAPSTGAPSVGTVAESLGTIPYEVLTSLSARVPRVYVRAEEVVAIDDLLSGD